jgi:hypothetical protein
LVPTIDQHATSSSSSFSFSHAANTLVIVGVSCDVADGGSLPTGVTIAGSAMTQLASVGRSAIWYAYRTTSGSETIALTGGSLYRSLVSSWTSTASQEPFFEDTVTYTVTSTSCSFTVAAGTQNRLIFCLNGAGSDTGPLAITPATSFSELDEVDWTGTSYFNAVEDETYANQGATTCGGTINYNAAWSSIGTAILPPPLPMPEFVFSSIKQVLAAACFTYEANKKRVMNLTVQTPVINNFTQFLNLTDSGAGSEAVVALEQASLSDSGAGTDTSYLLGEVVIDDIRLGHVLSIKVSEPTVMATKPVSQGLPTRIYGGKQGRIVDIAGWVDNIVDLNTLTSLADGNVHTLQIPTGKLISVNVVQVQPIREAASWHYYPYTIHAEERMD